MKDWLVHSIDTLIPLVFAVFLLSHPQSFTKKDLKLEENKILAKRLKTAGWVLVGAALLIFLSGMGQASPH